MNKVEIPVNGFETRADIEKGFAAVKEHFESVEKRIGVGSEVKGEDFANLRTQVLELLEGQKKVAEAEQLRNSRDMWGQQGLNRVAGMEFPFTPDEEFAHMSREEYNLIAYHPEELAFASNAYRRVYEGLSPSVARRFQESRVDDFTRLVEEVQATNDALLILDAVLYGRGDTAYAQRAETRRGRIKTLKTYKQYEKLTGVLRRALSTTGSAVGAEWLPTIYSAQLHEMVQIAAGVWPLFPSLDMPGKIYTSPVLKSDGQVYLVPEQLADDQSNPANSAIPASTPGTANMTLTAVKLAMRMFTSSEATEDLLIPVIPLILSQFSKVTARGLDEAVISADTAAGTGHIDNPVSGGPADAPSSPLDRRRAWVGLRAAVIQNSGMVLVDCTSATDANVLDIKGQMGVYGVVPSEGAWLMSIKGLFKAMQITDGQSPATKLFLRADTYGSQGTPLLTGQMGSLLGSPVILSDYVPNDTDATSAKRTAAGVNTCWIYVNRPAWQRGIRRTLTISRSAERHIEYDQLVFVSTFRGDFKPWFVIAAGASQQKIVGMGRKVG